MFSEHCFFLSLLVLLFDWNAGLITLVHVLNVLFLFSLDQ